MVKIEKKINLKNKDNSDLVNELIKRKFSVKPSTRKNKKYDVYENGKYILSFGDKRYEHYHDQLGIYKNLDHGDDKRRELYLKRSEAIDKDNLFNPYSANFWSRNLLW